MQLSALASGSSGNCFYISDEKTAILIDTGISAKQILERLKTISQNPEKIKAIFITHEHSDHIRGSDVLARKLNIPIFATKATAQKSKLCSNHSLINIINSNSQIKIQDLEVEAFSKSHTAADPVSYNIIANKKISIITDVGHACKNIISNISNCDFLCIESNHDELMLQQGPYPIYLKKWISSDLGHLSNKQAAECVSKHGSQKLKNILLAHLSLTNNTPDIALKTFHSVIAENKNSLLNPHISISTRNSPTPLFAI